MKRCFCFALSIIICFSVCSCKNNKTVSKTEFIFNTFCQITLENSNESVLNEAFDICKEYDKKFNKNNKNSELNRINNSNGKFVELSDEMYEIIKIAVYYSELSNGKFDITVKSITDLWDFNSEKNIIPSKNKISTALKSVGYKNIILKNKKIKLKNNSQIDLGGIAKGYVADKLKEFFINKNVNCGIINLGGNIVVFGENLNTIGIQKPFSENGQYIAKLNLNNKSVVTSGNYQRYFIKDNKIFHHILNTETGMPVENELESVTVISENSTDGDALSTLFFTLGTEESLKLLAKLEGTEAVFIKKSKEIVVSNGLLKNNDKIPEINLK